MASFQNQQLGIRNHTLLPSFPRSCPWIFLSTSVTRSSGSDLFCRVLLPSLFDFCLSYFLLFSICQTPGKCPLNTLGVKPTLLLDFSSFNPLFFCLVSLPESFSGFCFAPWINSNLPAPYSLVPINHPTWRIIPLCLLG